MYESVRIRAFSGVEPPMTANNLLVVAKNAETQMCTEKKVYTVQLENVEEGEQSAPKSKEDEMASLTKKVDELYVKRGSKRGYGNKRGGKGRGKPGP